jgi:hypothetical protein
VEGLALRDVQGATVQYHPEAGPGPHDALHLFDRFVGEIGAGVGENFRQAKEIAQNGGLKTPDKDADAPPR